MRIEREDPRTPDVAGLLGEHLADMFAESPPESVHALDLHALARPEIAFWTARDDTGALLGCGALQHLDDLSGELKSMRTATASRGRGVGAALLARLVEAARHRGYRHLYLETGTQDFFAPARRLYLRSGFEETGPFADYRLDPHSAYFRLDLQPS
jgi:putative acetyltransferase